MHRLFGFGFGFGRPIFYKGILSRLENSEVWDHRPEVPPSTSGPVDFYRASGSSRPFARQFSSLYVRSAYRAFMYFEVQQYAFFHLVLRMR